MAELEGHYRPLYLITILTEGKLFGLRALPYHLLSVLVHAANAALLWLIAMRATRRPLVAHLAALIFALHPTYPIAVGWISERSAMLATTGGLLSLWSFTKTLDERANGWLWYPISVAGYLAALFYHPKAVPVLLAIAAYYFFVHRATAKGSLSPRAWLRFVPYVAAALFPMIVSWQVRQEHAPTEALFSYGSHVYENFLHYLRLALVPHPFLADTNVYGASTTPWGSGIVMSAAWLGIGAWLLRDSRRRGTHLFALLWFLTSLWPLLTFTPGAFPRQLYIAGPGLALVLSLFFVSLLDSLSKVRISKVFAAALLVLCVVLASQRILISERDQGQTAARSRDFIEELRQTHPVLPDDAMLYIVGVPLALRLFGDVYLTNAIEMYYGDITIRPASEEEARAVEAFPKANERVFRYSGYD